MSSAGKVPLTIWGLLVLLSMIWSGAFLSVRIALDGLPPLTVAAIRILGAAVVLMLWAVATGRAFPSAGGRIWWHMAGFALFSNVLPFSLLSWAQQHVASGFAGITMAAVPLFVLPLAHFLVPGEPLARARLAGFLTGFAGVLLLVAPGALAQAGSDWEGLARMACVTASACYAVGSMITRRAPPVSLVAYSAVALTGAAAVMVSLALAADGVPSLPGPGPLLALLYLALGLTTAATLILVHIIRRAGPSFLSLANYQVPLWAVLFGAIALGETLPPRTFAALALILAGLALSQRAGRPAPATG